MVRSLPLIGSGSGIGVLPCATSQADLLRAEPPVAVEESLLPAGATRDGLPKG